MLKNSTYNLLCQLVEEHKSLWRIKEMYLKESEGLENEQEFWKKMEVDKETHINDLVELIKKEL